MMKIVLILVEKVLQKYFELNAEIGTLLNVVIGYDKAAELIQESINKNISIKELVISKKILSKKEADMLFGLKRNLK